MRRRNQGTRKRTGCTKCKEQHILCSEELPKCRRCHRLNLECVRGIKLVFREDALQRGISFGREGLWSKRPGRTVRHRNTQDNFYSLPLSQYKDRWIFLNLYEDDFHDKGRTFQERASPALRQGRSMDLITHSSIQFSIYHPFYAFQEKEQYLLDYFIRDIGPSCSLSSLYNPYISLMVPLCFESTILQSALLAAAANQLCLLGKDQFTEQACYYKFMALQGIRLGISSGIYDDDTIAAILMLCFHEISDACNLSWILHLRAGLQILDGDASRSSSELWKFFRMYFLAHAIMSRTTSESWDGDEKTELWHESEDLEEFDMLMGCSRGLLTLINKISIHSSAKEQILKHRSLTPSESQKYAKISLEIGKALLSSQQKLPARVAGKEDLERVAQIKHLAALLYLTERLGYFEPKCENASTCCSVYPRSVRRETDDIGLWPPTSQVKHLGARKPREPRRSGENAFPYRRLPSDEPDFGDRDRCGALAGCKNHLISRIIELMSTLPDMHTLLWPLFVLGNAGLQNEEQRRFVLDRLISMEKTQNLGSVKRTIIAVKHAFKTKSLLSPGARLWGHESYGYISLA